MRQLPTMRGTSSLPTLVLAPITIRSHDLHADDIRGVVGETASYTMRGTSSLPTLVLAPITIRSHDLHADDIRGVVGETAFLYHERD
jgi:hypothetical protein